MRRATDARRPFVNKEFNDVNKPVNSYSEQVLQILLKSIEASVAQKSISPLLRGIHISLIYSAKNTKESASILFSCDSFQEEHLTTQIRMFNSLKKSGDEARFCNFPISHYITSMPSHTLLETADYSITLLLINQLLINEQGPYDEKINENDKIDLGDNRFIELTKEIEPLFLKLGDEQFSELFIDEFPFHELAYRDLSLTFKCTPEIINNTKYFRRLLVQSNKFNLWFLCLLVLQENMGHTGYCMSHYTASNVFQFFCSDKRCFRYFGHPEINPSEFGLKESEYVFLLENPNSTTQLTTTVVSKQLKNAKMSKTSTKIIDELIEKRFKGAGHHTYSRDINNISDIQQSIEEWIIQEKRSGKQVVSLFTSSPDEVIGQQLDINFHSKIDHLNKPVFPDQNLD